MRMIRIICVGIFLLLFFTGCVGFVREVYVRAPDPEENNFIKVTSVSGRTITLSDGRKIELAGIDMEGFLPEQIKTVEISIRNMTDKNKRLVLIEEKAGKVRIEESYYRMPEANGILIPIFPRKIGIRPIRSDVGSRLILGGYARARLNEIGAPLIRKIYAEDEEFARRRKVGIWEPSKNPKQNN